MVLELFELLEGHSSIINCRLLKIDEVTIENDNNDGGPPKGGEFVLAISPELVAGKGWTDHSEDFFSHLTAIDGVRLPGQRRHKNRLDKGPRQVNKELLSKVRSFL